MAASDARLEEHHDDAKGDRADRTAECATDEPSGGAAQPERSRRL